MAWVSAYASIFQVFIVFLWDIFELCDISVFFSIPCQRISVLKACQGKNT